MTRGRRALVHVLLAIFVDGSLDDIVVREHWPCSQHPMFSWSIDS